MVEKNSFAAKEWAKLTAEEKNLYKSSQNIAGELNPEDIERTVKKIRDQIIKLVSHIILFSIPRRLTRIKILYSTLIPLTYFSQFSKYFNNTGRGKCEKLNLQIPTSIDPVSN